MEKSWKKLLVVGLRAKTYSYLRDDGSEDRTAKRTKRCVINLWKLNLEIKQTV